MFQSKLYELKAIALELGAQPVGDCRKIRTWELAIERAAESMGISMEAAYSPILRELELAAKNSPGVESAQELIAQATENSLGVEAVPVGIALSPSFLARYVPQLELIYFKPDAEGQLNLLDFEFSAVNEPPDPDDYDCMFAFWAAYDAWCDCYPDDCSEQCTEPIGKNLSVLEAVQEPIAQVAENFPDVGTVSTVSIESMCYWAPCDQLLLTTAPVLENLCSCGEVLASQCDGRTVTVRVYPNRTVQVSCYKNRVGCCSRSPPGGDVMA
ncbi:MAG: hypothetical protein JGK30_26020 [Microcoleus sp. PH2017_40_RAT_O_B]|uniref:hypothetical protein n=1 Tax=unclassified Microcoleus TaxID=2642155 RepID=UPI001D313007|nr:MULTISPECIES: hypothetical protein [unclassified Microcoleus]MCC3575256.1 hypothetical protein [Microcoleus sp. PH2017_34_RAT_O_A]MCC3612833.1 hypothetical protein [Microcoleus sp. PH2017_40_RAT_O_B]